MPSFSGAVEDGILPGLRLDRYVAENLGLLSRSQIRARSLAARVNGREVKISRLLKPGDMLELSWEDEGPVNLIPEDIALDIVYEDERSVVINKVQGMVVHPGAGNPRHTLANALFFRILSRRGLLGGGISPEGLSPGEAYRPGIVHRLDKDTSGLIIAAYDDEALRFLADQFKARKVRKIYAALIRGCPGEHSGRVETLICRDSRDRRRFTVSRDRGKPALTFYRVLRSWKNYSLVMLMPRTGRTHQLRVHMRYLGHPIAGDPLYGAADERRFSLMLHAKSLKLLLPGHAGPSVFKTPLPDRFRIFPYTDCPLS
jgi:23S rRNA pseudouridine1911/1915/1917 synthase